MSTMNEAKLRGQAHNQGQLGHEMNGSKKPQPEDGPQNPAPAGAAEAGRDCFALSKSRQSGISIRRSREKTSTHAADHTINLHGKGDYREFRRLNASNNRRTKSTIMKTILRLLTRPLTSVSSSPGGLLALLLGSASLAFAQTNEFPAAMKPVVEKYKLDETALDTLKQTAISVARQKYSAALSASEGAALNAGQLNVVAAITKEGEAAKNNMISIAPPAELPKSLLSSRKIYTDAIAAINTEIGNRQQKLATEYIRSLSSLPSASDQELSAAVATEKLRVLSQIKAQAPATPNPAVPTTATKPSGSFVGFAKPLKESVEIVPWVGGRFGETKFKPHDKRIPEELDGRVDGLTIVVSGKKRSNTGTLDGDLISHWGKLALISAPPPQSGTITAKEPWAFDATHYGMSLELASGKLKTSEKKLQENVSYKWSAWIDGSSYRFEIATKEGKVVNALSAPVADVKAFGFNAAVRYPGSKANITITVNASPQIK